MSTEPTRRRPSLAALIAVFARYANATFGGGSATIAVLRDELVAKHAWIDAHDHELAYALSRLTPGTNLLAYCTAVGWTTRRWLGAIVALLAASIPCSLLVVVVTIGYAELYSSMLFRAALSGALAAAIAVMVATSWVFAEPHVKAAPWKAAVIVPATAALSLGVRLSAVSILLLAAAVGLAWPVPEERA